MIAERDSMTLNEVSVPALGVEERSDEAPRAGRARPTPDPEVVAKPKRRQFTAEYRLRILEEADRCTQPGEVGRLLRREGLYSSHLTAWRKARRKGSEAAVELAAKKRGAETGRTQPAGCERSGCAIARARKWLAWSTSCTPRTRIPAGRAGKSCRCCWDWNLETRNALLIAVQPGLACGAEQSAWRRPAQALGVSRYGGDLPERGLPAGPQCPSPGRPRRLRLRAVRRQLADLMRRTEQLLCTDAPTGVRSQWRQPRSWACRQ